jgi:uncharacterized membrane protein
MAVAAGVGLLLIVAFGTKLHRREPMLHEGWAVTFGALGAILGFLGGAMTVTWPLPRLASNCCTHDNIAFGEPTLAFGAILLAAVPLLWRRAKAGPGTVGEDREHFVALALPISWFGAAMGLALFAIAVAGVKYKLFAAPPQEPISGEFANHPLVEAIFISALWTVIGLGAVLLPFALRSSSTALLGLVRLCWVLGGVVLVGFGVLNYFTHIGLLINSKAG